WLGAQRRADQALALHQHASHVEFGPAPAHQADQDQAAIVVEYLLIVCQVGGSHRVENHIGAAPILYRCDEAALVAIEASIGPELAAGGKLGIAAGGDEAGMAEDAAELYGGGADTTGSGMQQDALAGGQASLHEQIEPGGGEN